MKRVSFGIGVICTCLLFADSFVVKRRVPSTPSASKLKESCLQELSDLLQLWPALLSRFAHVQELSIQNTYDLLQDNGDCFFARASKEELSQFLADAQLFHGRMREMAVSLENHEKYLQKIAHKGKKG